MAKLVKKEKNNFELKTNNIYLSLSLKNAHFL